MRKSRWVLLVCLFALFVVPPAYGAAINLAESALNVDGGITTGYLSPGGLGTLTVTLSGAGSHYVAFFVDHEIDQATNTFFNEYGAVSGAPAAGQSWEIDEPGYVYGDIYDNFLARSLDGTNGVPSTFPDDVSMALGWDFALAADETAIIRFLLGDTAPAGGFYLSQYDPDSGAGVYFSNSLEIRGGEVPIPEPSTLLLFGNGLVGAVWFGRRRFVRK